MATPKTRPHPAPRQESWEDYLHEISTRAQAQCVTLTPIRCAVLELLFRHPQGLKAYDLLGKFKLQRANATPPTVYRALDFLMAQGFAHKAGNMFVACRHTSHRLPSLFLTCPHCHAVAELQDNELMQTLVATLDKAGYHLNGLEVELSAVCPACGAQ